MFFAWLTELNIAKLLFIIKLVSPMNQCQISLLFVSSLVLAACVSNPPISGGDAVNLAATVAGANGNVNAGMAGALTASGQAAAPTQIIDPGQYAKKSCKFLQTEYRKLSASEKKLPPPPSNATNTGATAAVQAIGIIGTLSGNQQLANTVQQTATVTGNAGRVTGEPAIVDPNALKMAQIEVAANPRNCVLKRADGTKFVPTASPVMPESQATANPPGSQNGAMTAVAVASALATGNGNMGGVIGGNVGRGIAPSAASAAVGNNQPYPPAAQPLGAYASKSCKALQSDYNKIKTQAQPAQESGTDKAAGAAMAIGLLGAVTGNQGLANSAQQAASLTSNTKTNEPNSSINQIQLAANSKGCTLK